MNIMRFAFIKQHVKDFFRNSDNLNKVSMVVKNEMDIIKTIEDEDEVENLSEESDVEIEVR
jgi:hypothetical protein